MSHFLPIMSLPVVLQSYSLFQAYHNSSENVVASFSRNSSRFLETFLFLFLFSKGISFVKYSLFTLLKSHCLNGYVSFFLKKIFHIFHKMFTGMEKIFTFFSFNHETSKSFSNEEGPSLFLSPTLRIPRRSPSNFSPLFISSLCGNEEQFRGNGSASREHRARWRVSLGD